MDTTSIIRGARRLWWIPFLTGLICIGLGIWCISSPVTSLPVFGYIFAGLMCLAGVLNLAFALSTSRVNVGWGWSLALGLLEIVCGVWLFMLPTPELTETFMIVVGIWVLVAAINSICECCMLSSVSPIWILWMVLLLIATIVFAMMFLANPVLGGVAVWLYLGISLIIFGFYRVMAATRLKTITGMI